MRRALPALGLLALAAFASAQTNQARLGASVNAYFFSDSNVRSALGSPALTYGVSAASLNRPQEKKLSFAYNIISASRNDSTLFILPATLGYEEQFADRRTATVLPYVRVEAGAAYYDVALHNGGYDKSFKSWGGVAAAEAGIVFNRNLSINGRYNLFQSRSGVNLSGFQVGLTYNFVGF